jgi:hypothetical protein
MCACCLHRHSNQRQADNSRSFLSMLRQLLCEPHSLCHFFCVATASTGRRRGFNERLTTLYARDTTHGLTMLQYTRLGALSILIPTECNRNIWVHPCHRKLVLLRKVGERAKHRHGWPWCIRHGTRQLIIDLGGVSLLASKSTRQGRRKALRRS